MKTTHASAEKKKSRWKTLLALLCLAGLACWWVYAPNTVVAMFFPAFARV